jgi:hypothetical protein
MESSNTPVSRAFGGIAFTFADRGPEGDDRDDELHAVLREFASGDETSGARVVPSGLGWGGAGNAVVLVMEWLALGAGAVNAIDYGISGVKSALAGARRVATAWRELRGRTEQEPDLSLGALAALCLVDLSTRIETLDGVALVSAVDLMAGRGATLSHVGLGQPCVVLFARDDHTWTYLVDSKGRLYSVAVGESLEWAWHFWETGRQSEKTHPTAKLLDGIDETELSD